ncbi:helix-turn-helix domain-containing protein [Pseudomonas sp. B22129]|uniref:helix-turn-helix domain-containing protein n=1 Tax=Pseudomonas sp. B22129 TaxID=3235111 RepID=UPI0037830E41
MEVKEAFGVAMRNARARRGLTQEDFHGISSRTYLSTLERGLKNVTLEKAVELARRAGVHPLTLIVEMFLVLEPEADLASLFKQVIKEIES